MRLYGLAEQTGLQNDNLRAQEADFAGFNVRNKEIKLRIGWTKAYMAQELKNRNLHRRRDSILRCGREGFTVGTGP